MQSIFLTAFSWAVAKHIDLSVTRRETWSRLSEQNLRVEKWNTCRG